MKELKALNSLKIDSKKYWEERSELSWNWCVFLTNYVLNKIGKWDFIRAVKWTTMS
jgi:hypothetical protein